MKIPPFLRLLALGLATALASLGNPTPTRAAGGSVVAWGGNDLGELNLPPGLTNVVAIRAGHHHTVALRADGTVVAWGDNRLGQTSIPPGLADAVAIAAGHDHNLALRADGTVLGWGNSSFGQTNIPPAATGVRAVAAGIEFSALLFYNGSVLVWGNTAFGLGTIPANATNVVAIAAGGSHLLALRADGSVIAWGRNNFGQTTVPPGLGNIVAITAGAFHSLALRADGSVVGWGLNADGQAAPPAVGLTNASQISAGYFHNLALHADATVAAWGFNGAGQLGVPPAAGSNVVALAAGLDHSVALLGSAPQFITPPADQTVTAGTTATFIVVADGTPPLAYQWQFNGTNLPGATGAVLTIANVQLTDAGPYRVIVSNLVAAVPSAAATLTVHTLPIITGQPAGVSVVAGSSATLTASAAAIPAPSFQWQFGTTDLPGETNASLAVTNCQPANAGEYRVVVSNAAGSTNSAAATLTVLVPPSVLLAPANRAVVANSDAEFFVRVSGTAPLAVQWQFENIDLPGSTSTTYTRTNAQPADAGRYRVRVSNAAGTNFSTAAVLTVNMPPAVRASPLSQSAILGASASFTVDATGTAPLAFQWNLNNVPLPGQTSATLNLLNVQTTNAGTYTVTIANVAGTNTSSPATLTVLSPPLITGQPTSQTVPGGSSVTLFADATGTPPFNYQWSFNGIALPGETNPFLDLNEVQARAAGRYAVTITNAAGGVASAAAWLKVRTLGRIATWGDDRDGQVTQPPAVAAARDVIHVAGGGEHSLALRRDGTVLAWGFNGYGQTTVPARVTNAVDLAAGGNHSLAALSNGTVVAWGRDFERESTVPAGLSNVVAVAAGFGHSLALRADGRITGWGYNGFGQTTVPATLTNAVAIAGGYYHSLALRADGTVTAWGDTRFNQTRVPAGLSNVIAIAAGDYHNLAVRGDGTVVSWGLNTEGQTTVPPGLTNVLGVAAGHAHSLALKTDGTTVAWGRDGEGQNDVPPAALPAAALAAGTAHSLALIAVKPVFLADPQPQTVIAGSSLTLSALADGTPVVRYQWQRFGTNLPGATATNLVLNNAQPAQAGDYTLIASNFVGTTTSLVAQVTVLVPPRITVQPTNQSANFGSSVTLTVTATGTAPLSYQWRHFGPLLDQTNASLTINPFTVANLGNYRVVITNAAGVVTSSIAVLSLNIPPVIALQPANRTVIATSNATFSVTAVGTAPVNYQWQFNHANIPGATAATYTVTNAQPAREGAYSVLISNIAGNTNSADATLTVLVPPTFTSQPASRTVVAGTDVTFGLGVFGTPTPAIQWRFNNTPIPDATNATLLLTSVQSTNAGTYDALVSNTAGTNRSTAATLTVNVPPNITSDPASQNVNAGATVIFGVTATGTAPLLYQWQYNGLNLGGSVTNTLTLLNVQPTNAGDYSVIVGNAANTITSRVATLTINVRPTITASPTNVTALVGDAVTFRVTATGTDPLSYYWRVNSTPIPGARGDTFTLNSVQEINAGIYSVIVSNQVGSALSGPALLKIIAVGPVQAWGLNSLGQTDVPPGLTTAIAVAAGEYHSLALRADGTVVAWGDNEFQQTNAPPGLATVTAISANGDHSLALLADGSVIAWGRNVEGQTNVPAGLTGIRAVAAGHRHSLALRSDGTLIGWGDNTFGQRTFPVGLSNVTALAAGQFHGLALRDNGTLAGWGLNNYGQSAIPAALTNVVAVSAGPFHNLALRADGTVAAWGRNFAGETTVPPGLSNVIAIAAGGTHSLALRSDGSVIGWGANADGQATAPALTDSISIAAGGAHSLAVGRNLVAPARLTTGLSGGNLIFLWPAAPGLSLESTTNLVAPIWQPATTQPPFVVPATGQLQFFRLRRQ